MTQISNAVAGALLVGAQLRLECGNAENQTNYAEEGEMMGLLVELNDEAFD